MKVSKIEWVRCPVCGNKTRLQIRQDTELNDAKDLQVTVIKGFEAKTHS